MNSSHDNTGRMLMDIKDIDALINENNFDESFVDPGFKLLPKKQPLEKRKSQKDGG